MGLKRNSSRCKNVHATHKKEIMLTDNLNVKDKSNKKKLVYNIIYIKNNYFMQDLRSNSNDVY